MRTVLFIIAVFYFLLPYFCRNQGEPINEKSIKLSTRITVEILSAIFFWIALWPWWFSLDKGRRVRNFNLIKSKHGSYRCKYYYTRSYTFSTNTANGIRFSASGIFYIKRFANHNDTRQWNSPGCWDNGAYTSICCIGLLI